MRPPFVEHAPSAALQSAPLLKILDPPLPDIGYMLDYLYDCVYRLFTLEDVKTKLFELGQDKSTEAPERRSG